jgi:hypothetical protein
VKWRQGNELGAEFFSVNSSLITRSTADPPRVNSSSTSRSTSQPARINSSSVKSRGGENQKSEAAPSLHAQAQQPELIGPIGGDKAKLEDCSQTTNLSEQLDRTDHRKNSKKGIDLSRLQKKLGPDHAALIHALKDIDPETPNGQELASIIENLDETGG